MAFGAPKLTARDRLAYWTKVQAREVYQRDRAKHRARWLLRAAVRRGDIVRPDSCSACGVVLPPPRAYSGKCRNAREADAWLTQDRRHIQAHHADYSKPYDVTWLCPRCHGKQPVVRPAHYVTWRAWLRQLNQKNSSGALSARK